MSKTIIVRHPAGHIDLGDGMQVDIRMERNALANIMHARVPVMALDCTTCDQPRDGIHDHICERVRVQIGTGVLVTYRTMMDGSAVDLEFEVDLYADKPAEPASDPALIAAAKSQLERVIASGSAAALLGWREMWRVQPGITDDDLSDLVKAAGIG